MTEIQSITQQIEALSKSVDVWNILMLWGLALAAVAAVFVVIATRVVVTETGKLADAQNTLIAAKDRNLKLELKQKDLDIANATGQASEAKEQANTAQQRAAGAEIEAAEAKTTQQRVEIELAKQQAKAAEAEKNLLELRERIKPRRLTDQQSKDFVNALKSHPRGVIRVGWTQQGGDECFNFLSQIIGLLKEAGWTVKNDGKMIDQRFGIQVIGVGIFRRHAELIGNEIVNLPMTPTLTAVVAAFKSANIDVRTFVDPDGDPDTPEIMIGSKPDVISR